jgi:alpha-beta hydrolase superfamily lysophospholipase
VIEAGGLFYDRYSTAGGQEWLMRIGPVEARPILIVPPLLEEMNRTRAFLATLMRLLAGRGFGCWLPDLPGTGESERALEGCEWHEWRQAVTDASRFVAGEARQKPLVASLRGGALLDEAAGDGPIWRFAPVEGSSLARDLVRASMLKPEELSSARVELAGYRLTDTLFTALSEAKPAQAERLRTVRLASDRAEAELKVEGPALWRRSEPANSPELAELLAADIARWSDQCGAS